MRYKLAEIELDGETVPLTHATLVGVDTLTLTVNLPKAPITITLTDDGVSEIVYQGVRYRPSETCYEWRAPTGWTPYRWDALCYMNDIGEEFWVGFQSDWDELVGEHGEVTGYYEIVTLWLHPGMALPTETPWLVVTLLSR